MRYKSLILALILIGIVWAGQAIYMPLNNTSENGILFLIEKGDGLEEISGRLRSFGLIRSKLAFQIFVLAKGIQNNLQAGKYDLSGELSAKDIAYKFAKGDVIRETITIIEGWDINDIAWHFENKGMFQAEEILEIAQDLEGYLFPDTYEISEPETGESNAQRIEKIIDKMLANFDSKITQELKNEIASQGKILREIVIMASLLEKEVQTYEDKQLVAGILWKRMKQGWSLQIDATITYLTGKDSLNLTKQDLEIDSPYNTYKYRGLPPAPICNPGLESIKAGIYYEESANWFYLSAPDGETIFSKTLNEHNINKAKYLKNNG